jgi:hypothetical protein
MVFKVRAYFKQESDIVGPHNNVAMWLAEACCMGLRTVQSILNVHRECKFSYQVKEEKCAAWSNLTKKCVGISRTSVIE